MNMSLKSTVGWEYFTYNGRGIPIYYGNLEGKIKPAKVTRGRVPERVAFEMGHEM